MIKESRSVRLKMHGFVKRKIESLSPGGQSIVRIHHGVGAADGPLPHELDEIELEEMAEDPEKEPGK